MNNIIIAKNLSYKFGNKKILDNVGFEVEKGSFTSIIGPSGCGKSTIAKALVGLIDYEGYISVCNMNVNKDNLGEIRNSVSIVFENPDNQFVIDNVEDELAFTLENLNYSSELIRKKIEEVSDYLGIENLLNKNIQHLSGGEKQLVALASVLVKEPKILILDESFTMLDGVSHDNLLKTIKKIHRDKKMTIVLIAHDMNDTVYSDKIIVLSDGKIVLDGSRDDIYKEEKKLKSIGLNLPFMVDLSNKLSYYDLLDKTMLNMGKMVDKLWK